MVTRTRAKKEEERYAMRRCSEVKLGSERDIGDSEIGQKETENRERKREGGERKREKRVGQKS